MISWQAYVGDPRSICLDSLNHANIFSPLRNPVFFAHLSFRLLNGRSVTPTPSIGQVAHQFHFNPLPLSKKRHHLMTTFPNWLAFVIRSAEPLAFFRLLFLAKWTSCTPALTSIGGHFDVTFTLFFGIFFRVIFGAASSIRWLWLWFLTGSLAENSNLMPCWVIRAINQNTVMQSSGKKNLTNNPL